MANNYYTFTDTFTPGLKARSGDLDREFLAIQGAFDNLPDSVTSIVTGTSTFAGTTTGAGNLYIATMPDTRLVNSNGDEVVFIADKTNTGAGTFQVDALTAVPVVRFDGAALQAGDIVAGLFYVVRFDATNGRFQLIGLTNSYLTDVQLSEANAATSEANAATSETNAATSETNAATSETNAASSASLAQEWAVNVVDDDVTGFPGQFSSLHWSSGAQEWATRAEDSLIPTNFGGNGVDDYSAFHWAQKASAASGLPLPTTAGATIRVNNGVTAYEESTTIYNANDGTAQIRGTIAGIAEIKKLGFADSAGSEQFVIRTDLAGNIFLENTSIGDNFYLQSTLAGGIPHQFLSFTNTSGVELSANGGRDAVIGVNGLDYIICDNLGVIEFNYAGTEAVAEVRSQSGGGMFQQQVRTGESGVFTKVLDSYDLGAEEFWDYDTNTFMGSPTQQRFRFNNADLSLVTSMAFDDDGLTSRTMTGLFNQLQVGTQIQIVHTTNLDNWAVMEVSGAVVDNSTWFEVPVTYVAHNGTWTTGFPPCKFTFENLLGTPSVGGGSPSTRLVYKFEYDDSGTGGVDPGSGLIQFSNLTPTSSNRMSISQTDLDGRDIGPVITDAWGGGYGALVRMIKVDDPETYMVWAVNQRSDQGTWDWTYINMVEWEGTWTDGDEMYIEFEFQPFIEQPATDHAVLMANATLSGQPRGGWEEQPAIRLNGGGGPGVYLFSGATEVGRVTLSGTTQVRFTTQNLANLGSFRFESDAVSFYDKSGILPRFSVENNSNRIQLGHGNDVGNGAPTIWIRERTSQQALTAGWGSVWVRADTPNSLMFTDDAGNDYDLTDTGATATTITAGWSTGSGGSGGSFTIGANAPLLLEEQATNDTPAAGQGQLWVRNDTPNTLVFTNDAGTDFDISTGVLPSGTAEGDIVYYTGSAWALATGTGNNVARILPDGDPGGLYLADVGPELRFIYDDAAGITWDHAGSGSAASIYADHSASLMRFDSTYTKAFNTANVRFEGSATYFAYQNNNFNLQVGQFGSDMGINAGPTANHLYLNAGNGLYGIRCVAPVFLTEGASPRTDRSSLFQMWVRNNTPQLAMGRNEDGDNFPLVQMANTAYAQFTTSTTAANPGVGYFKFNSATMSSVTNLYISDELRAGRVDHVEWPNWIQSGDIITFKNHSTNTSSIIAAVTGTPTDNTGWWTIPISIIDGATQPATNDVFSIDIQYLSRSGEAPQTITSGWRTSSGGSGGSLTIEANAPLFMEEQSADDNPGAGQGQFWVKNDTPNRPYYTGDDNRDWPLISFSEQEFDYSSTTTASDPGPTTVRFDSTTPASITNIYMDDESISGDWTYFLSNLATDDVIVVKSAVDEFDYLVLKVNGTVVDNTGWWTVPVSVVHSGSIFTDSDRIRMEVQWLSQGGGISSVLADTTPQLGGNLDVNNNDIVNDQTNGNIRLTPNGTGWVQVRSGKTFRLYDGDESDYLQMWHDGTDGRFAANGGVINLAGETFKDPVLQDYAVEAVAYTPTGTTQTLDYRDGPAFEIDLESVTGNVTVTLSNPPASGLYGQIVVRCTQDSATARTITWAGGTFRWAGGSAHPMNTTLDGFTIFTFETWDGGTTWWGAGADYA